MTRSPDAVNGSFLMWAMTWRETYSQNCTGIALPVCFTIVSRFTSWSHSPFAFRIVP